MNASTIYRGMRAAVIASVLAISFSARAAVYFSDSGAIPLGGVGYSFSTEQAMSGTGVIGSGDVTLVLTFDSGYHLDGTILGSLTLNYSTGNYSASFTPLSTSVGGQQTYTVTFDTDFLGLSPSGTWGLNLWDTSTGTSGIENGLVSWELQIDGASPVPEPVSYALALFGLVFVGSGVGRFYLGRRRGLGVRSWELEVGAKAEIGNTDSGRQTDF